MPILCFIYILVPFVFSAIEHKKHTIREPIKKFNQQPILNQSSTQLSPNAQPLTVDNFSSN